MDDVSTLEVGGRGYSTSALVAKYVWHTHTHTRTHTYIHTDRRTYTHTHTHTLSLWCRAVVSVEGRALGG